MKEIADLSTVAEVDRFIDFQICRDLPKLRTTVESRTWTSAERATNLKVDAVCKALERRAELNHV